VKTIYKFLIFAFVFSFIISCSNDFLKVKNQDVFVSADPLILSTQDQVKVITLNISKAGNEQFHISVYPKWLEIETMHGSFENGTLTLKYSVKSTEYGSTTDRLTGTLVVAVDNIGLFQTEIFYGNIGATPELPFVNVSPIEGKVIDACYNKSTDQMVIATQSPNRLNITHTTSGTSTVINLDKSPQCMEISLDGKTLIVGYTIAEAAIFSLETNSLLQSFPLDCVPFDVALGQNGWCYISADETNDHNLRSLNLTTGKLNSGKPASFISSMYGRSEIIKIPGQSLLAVSRTSVTPSGLLLFNIDHEIPNDTISYWHYDYNKMWILNDGSRFIASYGNCYYMPKYNSKIFTQPSITGFGRLNISQLRITSLDQCDAKHSFFAAERNVAIVYTNYMDRNDIIEQFDAANFNLIRTYKPSLTVVKKTNTVVLLKNEVLHVFTNKAGTKMYAIRAITPEMDVKQWSVETFDIN
jgi:hypothetical protein